MRDITKIDISKITRSGKYIDFDKSEIFTLTPEEVRTLRIFHKNPNIAKDYEAFYPQKPIAKPQATTKNSNVKLPKRPQPSRKYALAKDRNKYNQNYKTKKTPKITYGYRLIIGGLVVVLGLGYVWNLNSQAAGPQNDNSSLVTEDNNANDIITETFDTSSPSGEINITESPEIIQTNNVNYQRAIINKYCNIYQVNSDVVYQKIAELTDNFTSMDYLANYHINGVVCKGEEIYASSEEELLLYTVRCIKQIPDLLGVPEDNLYINNGYQSSTDYYQQISDISRLMGVDRCLVYAICRTECNFKSDLFINAHNPAGLRNEGSWWRFDTTEEGFIETCAEIIKYYRKIGKPLSNISYNTLAQVGAIHAPVSDGNEFWLDTVWQIYNDAKENEIEIFGPDEPTDKFRK